MPSLSITLHTALAIVSWSGARRRCRQDTCGPDVVLMWYTMFLHTSHGTPEGRVRSGISAKSLSAGAPIRMIFILGNYVDAAETDVDWDVTPSMSLLLEAVDQEAEIG